MKVVKTVYGDIWRMPNGSEKFARPFQVTKLISHQIAALQPIAWYLQHVTHRGAAATQSAK